MQTLCAQPVRTTLVHNLLVAPSPAVAFDPYNDVLHASGLQSTHIHTHAQRTTDADTDIDRQTDRQESFQKLEEHFLRPPPGAERRTTRAQPRAQPAHNRAHNPLPNRLTDLQIHRLADSQITDSQTYRLTD